MVSFRGDEATRNSKYSYVAHEFRGTWKKKGFAVEEEENK